MSRSLLNLCRTAANALAIALAIALVLIATWGIHFHVDAHGEHAHHHAGILHDDHHAGSLDERHDHDDDADRNDEDPAPTPEPEPEGAFLHAHGSLIFADAAVMPLAFLEGTRATRLVHPFSHERVPEQLARDIEPPPNKRAL
jgi:hypothetical protein